MKLTMKMYDDNNKLFYKRLNVAVRLERSRSFSVKKTHYKYNKICIFKEIIEDLRLINMN